MPAAEIREDWGVIRLEAAIGELADAYDRRTESENKQCPANPRDGMAVKQG